MSKKKIREVTIDWNEMNQSARAIAEKLLDLRLTLSPIVKELQTLSQEVFLLQTSVESLNRIVGRELRKPCGKKNTKRSSSR